MNIGIIGLGNFGYNLSVYFSNFGHTISVSDKNDIWTTLKLYVIQILFFVVWILISSHQIFWTLKM
jgi:hypothetical protein